jgi:hypothetical protein
MGTPHFEKFRNLFSQDFEIKKNRAVFDKNRKSRNDILDRSHVGWASEERRISTLYRYSQAGQKNGVQNSFK